MATVLLEKHAGYALITLNRPEQMNALSRELRGELVTAFQDCTADEDIRVIVLTGSGKAFCAGFDLKELASTDASAAEEADNLVARAMEAFPGPIIGAINGHAVTGGFELALACDILIGSENARFADTHARVGILPGWGLSQKLPRLIGLSRAREMAFTGAPVFAQQAYEWGLLNHVVAAEDLLPKAIEMAQNICACVPETLLGYKRLIEEGYSKPLDEALVWEEGQAIESAKAMTRAVMSTRKEAVIEKGRSEKSRK
ncbi:MAG: enoyl-CoA hydratase [Halieaceae bacterium]|jgi:enoyl-CoA hydratase|nr:enoyl-CoA hydratase [Halieaceae bacterium]